MKHIRKLLILVTACLFLLLPAMPAAADIIVEPNNMFYKLHSDDCTHAPRYYLLNSTEGHVYLYKSPHSSITVEGYPNGTEVYIPYLYTDPDDGSVWGLYNEQGWFLMSELSLIYDSQSFREEHADALTPYVEGSFPLELDETKEIVFWAYPGGKMSYKQADPHLTEGIYDTYTDEYGNTWGYIGYHYGRRNVWVCLNDPFSTEVGGYHVEKNDVSLKADPTPSDEISRFPWGWGIAILIITVLLIGVGILVVVAVTVVIICFVFVKKKPAAPAGADATEAQTEATEAQIETTEE